MRLARLVQLGVPAGAAPLETQHVAFINVLCLLAIAATVATALLSLVAGAMTPGSFLYAFVAGAVPPALAMGLNARGWHMAAGLCFMAYVLIATAGAGWLFGAAAGLQYWYLPGVVLVFMLFPVERRQTALAAAAALVAAFVAFCLGVADVPAATGLSAADLRGNFQVNVSLVAVATAIASYYAQRATARTRAELRALRERTDALLGAVLPAEFVATLREGTEGVGRRHAQVSVVVCDIAGFTRLAEEAAAEDIVRILNTTFGAFDGVCGEHGADKVKTVGDAYVAGIGLSSPVPSPAREAVALALRMRLAVERSEAGQLRGIRVRIGVGTGEAIAGVVGTNKLAYDLWGAAIEGAFAMEERALPDQVVVDAATWAELTPEERAAVVRGEPEGYRNPATEPGA